MAINLHLQNLSSMAANLDIRRFFINWDIPEGGVQIIGGPDGDAFIRFNNENDLLKAMKLSGALLLGQPVTLRIISKMEMEQLIYRRKGELQGAGPAAANFHPMAGHSGSSDHTGMPGDSTYPNPYTQVEQMEDNSYHNKRAYNDSEDDDDRHGHGYDGDWKRRKPSAAVSSDAAAGRYNRTNDGTMMGGTNYDGYYQDQQQDFSQQRGGYTGRYGQDERYGNRNDQSGEPGYVKMSNLGRSIAYKDLRDFFRKYDLGIEKGGITLKLDNSVGLKIAFIKFISIQDAIRAINLHNVTLQGQPVDIKRIHPNEYEGAKSFTGDREQMRNPEGQQESYGRDANNESLPGYIKIYNLSPSVRYKELREFFRGNDMMITQGGIILRNDQNRDSSTAYIKFCNYQDALKSDTLKYGRIHGQAVEMEMISSYQYEDQKAGDTETPDQSRSTNFDRYEMNNRSRNEGPRDGSRHRDQNEERGYVRINNVVASIRYTELREFFRTYDMAITRGGIILKNYNSDFSTAYIQFMNYQDAVRAGSTRYGRLLGNNIEMEQISASTFENQKAGKTDKHDLPKYDRYDQGSRKGDSIRDNSRQRYERTSGSSKEAGCIQIRNVDRSIRYKELREFFRNHNMSIAKSGIILPNEAARNPSTVYVKFNNQQDAAKAELLNTRGLPGDRVYIQKISESKFDSQDSWQAGQNDSKQGTLRKTEEPRPSSRQVRKEEVEVNYSPPGYIMLKNISGAVRYKELRAFFREQDMVIAKGGIILKSDDAYNSCTVYMKFNSLQDALRADSLDFRKLRGDGPDVEMEMISPTIFEYENTENTDGSKKGTNADRLEQDKIQPRSFMDMRSAIAPGDKFECFILLDQLPGDATACEVWGWFDGPRGFSKGVRLVRRVKEQQAMFAYVAFDNAQHRNAAKTENEPCNAWSAKGTYRHLAQFGPQYEVLEATETGEDKQMDADARAELRQKYYFDLLSGAADTPTEPIIFTDMIERSEAEEGSSKFLCFLFVRDVSKNATASSVWKQYGGSVGGSKGVAIVRRINGPAIFAYVAFADFAHRNAALTDSTKKFTAVAMYTHIAQFGPHCEIEESTGSGGNKLLPKEDRDFLRQKFFIEKVQVLQSIFSHMVARAEAEAPGIGPLYFLRLSAIPEDATACGMRKWLGGTKKTSKGAIVVRKIDPLRAMFAYVAFENKKDRQTALDECEDGLNLTVKDVCQHLAQFDSEYEILESADSGTDREISEEKRESLHKKFSQTEEDEEDAEETPTKGTKRQVAGDTSDTAGDEKKRKMDDDAGSDTEEKQEEDEKPIQKAVKKRVTRRKRKGRGKRKVADTKSENTEEENQSPTKLADTTSETIEDESSEVDIKPEGSESEEEPVKKQVTVPTRSTRSTRRSTRRTFFEKQETENADDSEDNDDDDEDD